METQQDLILICTHCANLLATQALQLHPLVPREVNESFTPIEPREERRE